MGVLSKPPSCSLILLDANYTQNWSLTSFTPSPVSGQLLRETTGFFGVLKSRVPVWLPATKLESLLCLLLIARILSNDVTASNKTSTGSSPLSMRESLHWKILYWAKNDHDRMWQQSLKMAPVFMWPTPISTHCIGKASLCWGFPMEGKCLSMGSQG